MSSAKLTLIGLEEYMQSKDSSLFSGFVLPSGIDEDLAINTILSRGGEWEVIYSNPLLIQSQVGYWCRKWERTFTKWINALNEEYNPLYNLDVFEEWTDDRKNNKNFNGSIARIGGATDTNDLTRTDNLTRTDDLKQSTNTDIETENTRSAMDASTYQPYTKEHVTGDEDDNTIANTGTVKNTGSVKDTGTVTNVNHETVGTNNREDEADNSKHFGHRYGNQGITMSQDMLSKELEIARWNIYEHIADIFLSEFTIPLYT